MIPWCRSFDGESCNRVRLSVPGSMRLWARQPTCAVRSTDVRPRNLTIDSPATFGIETFEGSQVSLASVTARDAGFAALAALNLSDVHHRAVLF